MKLNKIIEKKNQWLKKDEDRLAEGKMTGYKYTSNNDFERFAKDFSKEFLYHNPLHSDIYQASRQIEAELISMTVGLYNGDKNCCGVVTPSGPESIIMALLAYREKNKHIRNPQIIIPESAQPAYEKAALYLGLKIIKIPLNKKSFQVNYSMIRKAINRNTICIVGSAPSWGEGACDPIPQMASIAHQKKIGFHVDLSSAGFIIPFANKLNIKIPACDFSVEGITSISLDFDKSGLSPVGASIVMYRTKELRRSQYYSSSQWQGGLYVTPAWAGSRTSAYSAGAWFSMVYHGYNGFRDIAKNILDCSQKLKNTLSSISDVEIMGDAMLNIITFTTKNINGNILYNELAQKGWILDSIDNGINITITLCNIHKILDLPHDIRNIINDMKQNPHNYKVKEGRRIYGTTARIPEELVFKGFTQHIHDVIMRE